MFDQTLHRRTLQLQNSDRRSRIGSMILDGTMPEREDRHILAGAENAA
jgi:hypothetical protein